MESTAVIVPNFKIAYNIGINNYQEGKIKTGNFIDLISAERDAKKLREFLIKLGFSAEDPITTTTHIPMNMYPNIVKKLDHMVIQAELFNNLGSFIVNFISYSGHGAICNNFGDTFGLIPY